MKERSEVWDCGLSVWDGEHVNVKLLIYDRYTQAAVA
jgi:hypothetical protein